MNQYRSRPSQGLFLPLAAVLIAGWIIAWNFACVRANQEGRAQQNGDRRVAYLCPGGETFAAVFAADGRSVTLIASRTSRRLEAAADGEYFTADAVFFGDDPETGAYVAEGETVVLQDCRPQPAQDEAGPG